MNKQTAKRWCHKYIRLKAADENGWVRCVTCHAPKQWNDCDTGHFIHGLDFVEKNLHPQCVHCNHYNSGKMGEYYKFMLDTYGQQEIDLLKVLKKQTNKKLSHQVTMIGNYYKDKCKILREEKGL